MFRPEAPLPTRSFDRAALFSAEDLDDAHDRQRSRYDLARAPTRDAGSRSAPPKSTPARSSSMPPSADPRLGGRNGRGRPELSAKESGQFVNVKTVDG
jgi:hypothetical protein